MYINYLTTILRNNDVVMAQIENNPESTASQGNLPSATKSAIIQALTSYQGFSAQLLKTDENNAEYVRVLYQLLKAGEVIDVKSLP